MSNRMSIANAYVEKLKAEFNGITYTTNLFGNVSSKMLHFDDMSDFPFVIVVPGRETREYHPSGFSWVRLTMYFRVFVSSEDNAQNELEAILSDLEKFIDLNDSMHYTYNSETTQTTQSTILSIDTDEGLLEPEALGEISVEVLYEKTRAYI